jgi:uncharacterized damage-inducible protein DinB
VHGVSTALQPVAHALLQMLEDVEQHAGDLDAGTLWRSPGGVASVGFHIRHLAGSTDRLFTYARGEPLSDAQRTMLAAEKEPSPETGIDTLLTELRGTVRRALEQLRATDDAELDAPREVGRARLPSSVRGLLHHAGEHAARHAGQIITTVKLLRAS